MKKIVGAMVLGVVMVACASSEAEVRDDEGDQEVGSEEVGSVASAVTFYGYCDVSSTTGLLTGRCRGCSNMCTTVTDSQCTAGARPLSIGVYPTRCGSVRFDRYRRCSAWMNC